MIDGVIVYPLRQILDYRGKVMKMLDRGHLHSEFGEIYFSIVSPNMVKAWHIHKEMELNYACISGKIQLVLYDTREGSRTYEDLEEIYLSPEDYKLVHVPAGVINGFKGLGVVDSIVANLASMPYSDEDITRFPLDYIEYNWFPKGQ